MVVLLGSGHFPYKRDCNSIMQETFINIILRVYLSRGFEFIISFGLVRIFSRVHGKQRSKCEIYLSRLELNVWNTHEYMGDIFSADPIQVYEIHAMVCDGRDHE